MPGDYSSPRGLLLDLYAAGLAAVDGAVLVQRALQDRHFTQPVHLIAIGKAAGAMGQGARQVLGTQLASALVITRHGHVTSLPDEPRFIVLTAGHPVPDAASLAAGEALLRYLRRHINEQLIFLLSGGASSLCEMPVAGVTLADLQRATRWLLGSGLPIKAINAVRSRLSQIKNGGLLAHINAQNSEALLLSDVPDDDPAVLGSGLLFSVPQNLPEHLPDWLQALLPPESVNQKSPPSVSHSMIGNNAMCLQAIARAAQARGKAVFLHETPLVGAAEAAGVQLAKYLRDAPAGVHLWGGETTVVLPAKPGRGGRCQQLALRAACELAGCKDVLLLAAGTDGSDGNSEDAGALIDGGTIVRGHDAGLDARDCLARTDAGTYLAASGDLLHTGPTGTNVMDIVLGYKQ